jgi:hypothetical protein
MDVRTVGDRLETLGIAVGAFLILGSLGTLAGMPWQTNPEVGAVALQLVGIALTVGLGVAMVWIARTD